MSYLVQSHMARDYNFIMRIAACAAGEGERRPSSWADDNRQRLIATPGWATRWKDAIDAGLPSPGEDETVITDADIIDAVRRLRALDADASAPNPEE